MPDHDWLRALRRYLAVSALGNSVWEFAHLPLYTVWSQGTPRDKLVAVWHCTAGDILIAVSAWALAVMVIGRPQWPAKGFWHVAVLVIALGLAYTGYSEWLNATVRQSWTYSHLMPVIPWLGLGLSPMLQWLVIPSLALLASGRRRPSGAAGALTASHGWRDMTCCSADAYSSRLHAARFSSRRSRKIGLASR